MGGLLSFLGGTAFRWLFGEIFGFIKAKQEHAQELERMRLSLDQEAQRHKWQQEAIAAQAAAGVKVIEAQTEASARAMSDQMLLTTMQTMGTPSGIKWIDGFNALIRPELAQVSIILLVGNAIWPQHVILTGLVGEVVCAALGLFLGGRIGATGR